MGRRPAILKYPKKFSLMWSDIDPRKEMRSIQGDLCDLPQALEKLMSWGVLEKNNSKKSNIKGEY